MNTTNTDSRQIPSHLQVVLVLARLLQRLEHRPRGVSAGQYRDVATRLAQALDEVPADRTLQAILDAYPAAAEVYENLHYRHAGLCRSPLELAFGTEMAARDAIGRAALSARASGG